MHIKNTNFFGKDFMLGSCENLTPLPSNVADFLKIRTNVILYNALLGLESTLKYICNKVGEDSLGVVIGTTTTGVNENYISIQNNTDMDYLAKRSALCNPSLLIKELYDLQSLNFATSSACTSGTKAIINGARLIKSGLCQAVICGGVDSLNVLSINGFSSLDICSETHTNPLSSNRDGINIGEGAALVLLVSDELAKSQDLENLFRAEIKGYANNNDAFHITQPSQSFAMQQEIITESLHKSGLNPSDIDYINLHGTGTIANDFMEANLISSTFNQTPISSTKPFMGHTLGAAGALECGICIHLVYESLQNGESLLPPHFYDGHYDKKLPNINLVKEQQKANVKNAMSLSFAFGGDNSVIIVGASD